MSTMDAKELRKVILLLVRACNRSRRNLMAANMAIHAISNMSPGERKALTAEQIQAELKSIERQLVQQPDPDGLRIENVLSEDGDFLEPLRDFASRLRW
jgi:uncharacterized membrane protein